MNKGMLTGRIANDLELRATPNGNYVCQFNLATNRPVNRDGERVADFVTCVVWGKQAENLCNYQGKGSLIGVIGSMRVDNYDKADGTKAYKTYVLANEVEFLGTKKTAVDEQTEKEIEGAVEESDPYADFGQQIAIDESDLPF